jgi:hypothetical protein
MLDVERYFVAILALGTPVDVEARALAAEFGTTAYEERLKLSAGVPAVVLTTVDEGAANGLTRTLEGRGHRALLVRGSEIARTESMISLRDFTFDDSVVTAGGHRLAWVDVAVMVRARHVSRTENVEVVKKKKLDLGRAVMTGGLMINKTVKQKRTTHSEDSEQVLYVFPIRGTPWLLRERATHYAALGALQTPTTTRNFTITVEQFRSRARTARFDDSLLRRPAVTDADLYAHLLSRI